MDLDARRLITPRLLMFAAIGITIGAAIWVRIPSDRTPPLPAVAIAAPSPDLRQNRLPDPHSNSPVPRKAAAIFVSLAAQLRGGERASLDVDGEDGWTFHEANVHYLDPRQVPAGVPLFVRITYSGTTWGRRAEARTFSCGGILTFVANRRYNLWCGEKDDVVVTLLE
jgi:hypothetical protein